MNTIAQNGDLWNYGAQLTSAEHSLRNSRYSFPSLTLLTACE